MLRHGSLRNAAVLSSSARRKGAAQPFPMKYTAEGGISRRRQSLPRSCSYSVSLTAANTSCSKARRIPWDDGLLLRTRSISWFRPACARGGRTLISNWRMQSKPDRRLDDRVNKALRFHHSDREDG